MSTCIFLLVLEVGRPRVLMRIIIPLFGRIFDLLSRPCQGKWRGVVSDMPILVHNFFRPFDPLFGVVVPTISHSPPFFNSSVNPKLPSSRIEPSGYIYPGPALSKYCRTKLDSNHRIHSTDFWKLCALTKTLRLARLLLRFGGVLDLHWCVFDQKNPQFFKNDTIGRQIMGS